MSVKKWIVKQYDKQAADLLCETNGYSGALAVLLAGRGYTQPQAAEAFLNCQDAFCDPYSLIDMDIAVERIERALDDFEKIAVYGDYDADGVTATALLYSYLCSQGADVIYYIPNREGEGYGLHNSSVDKLKQLGVQLIITVDNGISAVDEVEYIKSLGMDIIVTDHHMPGDILPNAIAVVNPHRADCPSEFKQYAGVGVAFKLIQALDAGDPQDLLEEYADLVAMGTIGDVVQLSHENRAIVKYGLNMLANTNRYGIKALVDLSGMTGKRLTGTNVAFTLIPRINAAGRMGTPDRAVQLLLSEDEDEAMSLAREIDEDNRHRQQIEVEIFEQALAQLEQHPSMKYDRVLVIDGENWHRGVIGIVATRMCEKYGKPCIMISTDGDEGKGSGRSIEGFSLYDGISASAEHLIRFGGHTLAAGLNVKTENIDAFRKAINNYAQNLETAMPVPTISLDFKLKPSAVSLDTIADLERLEPFGSGNPTPLFGLFSMKIEDIIPLAGGKHIRLTLSRGTTRIQALKFGTTVDSFPYVVGDAVDLAVTADKNEFRGDISLSVIIKEIRPSGLDELGLIRGIRIYEAIRRNDKAADKFLQKEIPNRDDIAVIYRFLRTNNGWDQDIMLLYHKLCKAMSPCKLMLALDVMFEMGLITYDNNGGWLTISICDVKQKIDIEKSSILQQLKSRVNVW